ncbi:AAA family ATPase [Idiomarina seosinensis]|uniref:AAA family ATPase n=1 Tax=Idiomarina seosinensis TaxID=281739 RepID=UPI00384E2722
MQLDVRALRPDTESWLKQRPKICRETLLVGQQRALDAMTQSLSQSGCYANAFAIIPPGLQKKNVLNSYFEQQQWQHSCWFDWLYLADPEDPLRPLCINVPSGTAHDFMDAVLAFIEADNAGRESLHSQLVSRFDTQKVRDYLQRISDKTVGDFSGGQFASVIVGHQHPAPFYYCDRVSEARLFGQLGVQSIEGTVRSDLHLIEPGLLLTANGGVLAIEVHQLLENLNLWRRLKDTLLTGLFEWPQPSPDSGPAYFYRPQPIPVDIKIILLGNRHEYAQLREYDEDFDHLFPFLADFHRDYPLYREPVADYFHYLQYVWQQADVLPLDDSGYSALLRVSARQTEFQQELSLDSVYLMQVLREAHSIAAQTSQTHINGNSVDKALSQQLARESQLAELSRRSIIEQQVRIETDGEVIGQINGLTVVTIGGSDFGEPSRITATIHYGDGDIIDIERKSDMSGNIHTKGVMILSAYLANQFARHEPMSVSATVVFEQSYFEVDGDSASMAELCGLISALAEVPLKQALAVTGAIDQFGNVQAIGAVNEKIEGYFGLCKELGLSGQHGVIIPAANQAQLNLNREVIDAVAAGDFRIYAVKHVEQALELLSGLSKQQLFKRVEQRIHDNDTPTPVSWWQRLMRKITATSD